MSNTDFAICSVDGNTVVHCKSAVEVLRVLPAIERRLEQAAARELGVEIMAQEAPEEKDLGKKPKAAERRGKKTDAAIIVWLCLFCAFGAFSRQGDVLAVSGWIMAAFVWFCTFLSRPEIVRAFVRGLFGGRS